MGQGVGLGASKCWLRNYKFKWRPKHGSSNIHAVLRRASQEHLHSLQRDSRRSNANRGVRSFSAETALNGLLELFKSRPVSVDEQRFSP